MDIICAHLIFFKEKTKYDIIIIGFFFTIIFTNVERLQYAIFKNAHIIILICHQNTIYYEYIRNI